MNNTIVVSLKTDTADFFASDFSLMWENEYSWGLSINFDTKAINGCYVEPFIIIIWCKLPESELSGLSCIVK